MVTCALTWMWGAIHVWYLEANDVDAMCWREVRHQCKVKAGQLHNSCKLHDLQILHCHALMTSHLRHSITLRLRFFNSFDNCNQNDC